MWMNSSLVAIVVHGTSILFDHLHHYTQWYIYMFFFKRTYFLVLLGEGRFGFEFQLLSPGMIIYVVYGTRIFLHTVAPSLSLYMFM